MVSQISKFSQVCLPSISQARPSVDWVLVAKFSSETPISHSSCLLWVSNSQGLRILRTNLPAAYCRWLWWNDLEGEVSNSTQIPILPDRWVLPSYVRAPFYPYSVVVPGLKKLQVTSLPMALADISRSWLSQDARTPSARVSGLGISGDVVSSLSPEVVAIDKLILPESLISKVSIF